jgi:hypothetical protein
MASTVRYVSTTGKDSGTCSPSACKTIKYAIGQAAAGDTISIGPGTFEEGGLKVEGKALDFVGAGAGTAGSYEAAHDTLIDGSKLDETTITDTAGGSFSDLRIEGGVSDGPDDYGTLPALYLLSGTGSVSFALSEIVATQPTPPVPPPEEQLDDEPAVSVRNFVKGATNTTTITGLTVAESEIGLSSENTALTLSHSTITGFGRGDGIELTGAATVSETTVTGAETGVNLSEGSLNAVRDRIAGTSEGVRVVALYEGTTSTATVRDSLIEALPSAGADDSSGADIIASNRPGALAQLIATGSTLVAYGKGAGSGLRVVAEAKDTATAQLANTIAYGDDPTAPGAASDISAERAGTAAEGPGIATVTAATSSYSTAKAEPGTTITAPGSAGNITGYPDFTNPATGEFTLTSGSPLLERGNPSLVLPGELDLAGNPRIDGDCRLGHAPDIGAYELPLGSLCPSSGGSSTGTVPKGVVVPATISRVSFSPPRRASGHGKHAKHARAGVLTFTLSEAATVKLVIERELGGYLKKGACLARAKSKSKPKACKLIAPVSSIELSGRTGTNTVAIPSVKLLSHLKAGRYKLVVSAVGPSGASSAPQTIAFKLS